MSERGAHSTHGLEASGGGVERVPQGYGLPNVHFLPDRMRFAPELLLQERLGA